jgi:hypothetical protein
MGKKSSKEKVGEPLLDGSGKHAKGHSTGELLYLSLLNLPTGTRKDGQGKKAQ